MKTKNLLIAVSVVASSLMGFIAAADGTGGGGVGNPQPVCGTGSYFSCGSCTANQGDTFNCCSTVTGGCCDQICRQVTCSGTNCNPSYGANVAQGVLDAGQTCGGGQQCE